MRKYYVSVHNMLTGKNKIQKRVRLKHKVIKNIIKQKRVFYTDALIQILFSVGYTSYNVSQHLSMFQ